MGLIDFIPHLCESANPDAEVIHACGLDWTEQGLREDENAVGWEANEAGKALADAANYNEVMRAGATLVIPVSKQYPRAQVVGVARMRYRPRTRRTFAWILETADKLATHIERYAQLRQDAERRRARVVGQHGG